MTELAIAGIVIFLAWRAQQLAAGAPSNGIPRILPIGEPVQLLEGSALQPVGGTAGIQCAGGQPAPAVTGAPAAAVTYAPQGASVGTVPTGNAIALPWFIGSGRPDVWV